MSSLIYQYFYDAEELTNFVNHTDVEVIAITQISILNKYTLFYRIKAK